MTSETRVSAPHDELRCELWPHVDGGCPLPAVISVVDRTGVARWGCERHAATALSIVEGAKISKVADWDAARRLLSLPWNTR